MRSAAPGAQLSVFVLLLWAGVMHASEAEDNAERQAPIGRWSTGGTLIEVTTQGASLSARLIALKHPLYRRKDGRGEVGAVKVDDQNPDPALRERPLLGLELFSDFEFRRGRWSGRVYSPESGRTFSARIRVKDNELHVRGFILGMPWLGRSTGLLPVAVCDEDILKMISTSGIDEPACTPTQ
ncbi:MAG: DUF2147 domain-containing protein [Pseudomonadales bacterium]|nr:DUF2147 domain-containing protein [Pseudomonadales bacterium]